MSTDQRMRDFGVGLRRYRHAAGRNQIELAGLMAARGLPWYGSTVSKTESGDRPPRLSELHALAAVLNVHVGDLVNPAGTSELIRHEQPAATAVAAQLAGLLEQVAQVSAVHEQHLRAAGAALAVRGEWIIERADDGSARGIAGPLRRATTPARGAAGAGPHETPPGNSRAAAGPAR